MYNNVFLFFVKKLEMFFYLKLKLLGTETFSKLNNNKHHETP